MPVSNELILESDCDTSSSVWTQMNLRSFGRKKFTSDTTGIRVMVFTTDTLSDTAKQFIAKLQSFKSLESNWDSYGAQPPSMKSIHQAISIVNKADKNLLPLYFTAPGPNGELIIEFRNGKKEGAIYINSDGSTELILSEGGNFILEGTVENNYKDLLHFINS